MASTNSSVSYNQVYKQWLSVDYRRNGESTIPVKNILLKLILRKVLVKSEYQELDHEKTDEEKSKMLFLEIMPAKGEQGFNELIEILFQNNYNDLAKDLGAERDKWFTDVSTAVQNPLTPIQTHLSRLIKENIDFAAKYSSRDIPLAQTEAVFANVQILAHFKAENGVPVHSYREMFHKDGNAIQKRILIQADPGCGKTTYVNKLALDWANEDAYLRDKFNFVFLIALQTLRMDVLDAIKCFLPKESQSYFNSYAESAESKILLILDGFDELADSSEWYSSVMDILNGQSMQFQFYYVIVTTRRSHVDKIPEQFHGRSLLIRGFDEQSMKQFLGTQHVPLPSVGQQSNLSHLLQTPLYCAIYCSLHFGGGGPIELEDSYDLIKPLVENSITNTRKKKTVANKKEQLDEIGKFAFLMLDSSTLDFVKTFCSSSEVIKSSFDLSRVNLEIGKFAFQMLDSSTLDFRNTFYSSSEVIKPSFDLSRVNLDLLIKRRIPLVGVNRFKEDFSLPHQLIAEYLSARYFAHSLTEEQLKQADTKALNPTFISRVLDLPFVRFFLFESLFLYLEKKYEESVFDNFLIHPELRFIWNMKSNKDIRTLDNVSDLDFNGWNSELVHHSRFIPTLSKCRYLSSLNLRSCGLSKNQVERLGNFINNNCLQKLIKLNLGWNENVGSTPELFTALSKCEHLQVLDLSLCKMTVESTTELARCIDKNGLANLKELYLYSNENVGSSIDLFSVLHKCRQLQRLELHSCSITQESLNIFLPTFNSNAFQQLDVIWLSRNEEIKVDDNFFIVLEKCPNVSLVLLSEYMESDLSEVGRRAKETLKQRGCQFEFY